MRGKNEQHRGEEQRSNKMKADHEEKLVQLLFVIDRNLMSEQHRQ